MSDPTAWMPIDTAPKSGAPFLALNHDREVWVSRYDRHGRIQYRTNGRYEPRKFEVREIDGEELLKEDKEFAVKNECWRSDWTIWSRGYDFKSTHWMPLPLPPDYADSAATAIRNGA